MTLGEGAALEIIAANTIHLEALQRDISALSQRITKPADIPLILSELQEHHQQDHHQMKSLSKTMTTLVTLATTAVLAMTGAGAAVAAWASQLAASASLAATVIGATSQAMFVNLCARTMNAIIETGANIGQTLKATASSEAMKSLIKTGIRAGAIAGVTTGLGIAAPLRHQVSKKPLP